MRLHPSSYAPRISSGTPDDVPASVMTFHCPLGPVLTTTRLPAFAPVLSSADTCSPLECSLTSWSSFLWIAQTFRFTVKPCYILYLGFLGVHT